MFEKMRYPKLVRSLICNTGFDKKIDCYGVSIGKPRYPYFKSVFKL